MISLKNLALQRGGKLLFSDVNLTFYSKQRIGLIGKNGSGKSSLLALILQQLSPDQGEVTITANAQIAYIDQEVPHSERNVIDYVIDADAQLRAIEQALQDTNSNYDGVQHANWLIQFENHGGYTAKSRAASLLHGLGFTEFDQRKAVNELSGGLQRRLNLARTLFVPSEVLLLDEPTNHLDLETVIWLEQHLSHYVGLIIIISHDRDFLDSTVTHIAQLEQQKIKLFTGNYSAFETQNALQLELQQKGYITQQKQIAHLEKFIARFRAKASKARQAQSRIKLLEKMQLVAPVYKQTKFNFEFFPPQSLPNILLKLEDVTFAYGEQCIFRNLNFRIEAGMRIGLLGRNGVGKSTLLKLLLGELTADLGMQWRHHKLQVGYFAQYQLDNLNLNASPLEHLQSIAPETRETELRTFLGRFDFDGDMALQKVATFSGGEKARLVLALIVWQRPNLLLLDEPTNHLDITMREALAYALQSYTGAMLIVSHDRHLLRSTVDDFYLISQQNIEHFAGDLEDYQQWLFSNEEVRVTPKTAVKTQELPPKRNLAKNRIQRIEVELKVLQPQLAEIEKLLASDATYQQHNAAELNQLIAKQQELAIRIKKLEDEWLQCTC